MGLNKIILMGRLVKDPEIRTVGDSEVTSFRIAVDRNYIPKGKERPDADFFDITLWNGNAKFAAKHYTKGCQVYVVGSLENHSYEGKNGKVYCDRINATETGFAESKSSDSTKEKKGQSTKADNSADNLEDMGFTPMSGDFIDDLPFNLN